MPVLMPPHWRVPSAGFEPATSTFARSALYPLSYEGTAPSVRQALLRLQAALHVQITRVCFSPCAGPEPVW